MSNFISKFGHSLIKKIFFIKSIDSSHSSEVIKNELKKSGPTMIARFGSTEIKAVLYPRTKWPIKQVLKEMMNYNKSTKEFENMKMLSGFYPSNNNMISQFSKLMIEDSKQLDILGSWRFEERFLHKYFPKAIIIPLNQLEPYLNENPWSEVLRGKKVLVIHPFNKTIEKQYHQKRSLLFKDPRVLPKFQSLETIKAIQTLAGNNSKFDDWFQALEFMKAEIDKKDFDIAIIGAGAYGFPLAAHVKKMGKKAVHLGGATQILFGIKGKRWLENDNFKNIINDHFVFPDDTDKIENASKVEDSCYW